MAIYALVCVPLTFSLQKSKKVPGTIQKMGVTWHFFYFEHKKTLFQRGF
jgi:hypothetical protein